MRNPPWKSVSLNIAITDCQGRLSLAIIACASLDEDLRRNGGGSDWITFQQRLVGCPVAPINVEGHAQLVVLLRKVDH